MQEVRDGVGIVIAMTLYIHVCARARACWVDVWWDGGMGYCQVKTICSSIGWSSY